jgi:hypothetical protein
MYRYSRISFISFSSAVLNPEIIKEGIARINEFITEEKQIKEWNYAFLRSK